MVVEPIHTRGRGWAVICLHDPGDTHLQALHHEFSRHYPDGQFYFPAVIGDCIDATSPLAAYVFVVRACEPAILKLEACPRVSAVMRDHTGHPARVTDEELLAMVHSRPLTYLRAGQRVAVTAGDWSGLEAEVLRARAGQVHVRVHLNSQTRDLTLDRAAVRVL